jgi:hypothetical protein
VDLRAFFFRPNFGETGIKYLVCAVHYLYHRRARRWRELTYETVMESNPHWSNENLLLVRAVKSRNPASCWITHKFNVHLFRNKTSFVDSQRNHVSLSVLRYYFQNHLTYYPICL